MFSEQDRAIFEYESPDGSKRYADPLLVRHRLMQATECKFDDIWGDYCKKVPEGADEKTRDHYCAVRSEASVRIADAVRHAFGLQPVNSETGVGVPGAYCLALAEAYLRWKEQKKTSTTSGPTM